MIRKTLNKTKDATFAVELPSARHDGMPFPMGTGFFVSADGWFVTAAHVVTENGTPNGKPRADIGQAFLMKEVTLEGSKMCQNVSLEYLDPLTDFALLRSNFEANANKSWLVGKTEFPFIEVSSRSLEEGEPVYAFGYPSSEGKIVQKTANFTIGTTSLCPRVTSAIVASTLEATRMMMGSGDPRVYVLDKALNYGNSGGPIVAAETGKVHALCSRFQPLHIPQGNPDDPKTTWVTIPSLYGVVSSLSNPQIIAELAKRGVPVSDV